MIEYPKEKQTLYTINTIKGPICFLLKQAKAQESIDLTDMSIKLKESTEISEQFHRYRQIRLYRDNKLKSSAIKDGFFRRRKYNLVIKYFDLYIEQIREIVHPTRTSKYQGLPAPKPKNTKDGIFNGSLLFLSEAVSIPINEIYEKLTIEQIGFLYDKLTYDYYESFDEGKPINSRIRGQINSEGKYKELLEYIKT